MSPDFASQFDSPPSAFFYTFAIDKPRGAQQYGPSMSSGGGVLISLLITFILILTPFANGATPFGDQALDDLLTTTPSGIIYTWSPGMPLSINGLFEAEQLAAQEGIDFTALVDPYLSPDDEELKSYAQQRIASKRLMTMGVLNHYPGILVFSHGRISSPLLQGYQEPVSLQQFIEEHL